MISLLLFIEVAVKNFLLTLQNKKMRKAILMKFVFLLQAQRRRAVSFQAEAILKKMGKIGRC